MSMLRDLLTERIERVDLPALLAQLWPDSGARPGRPGLYRAFWRGDRNPSLSLFRHRGVWFWRDHATGERGNAYHLLLRAGFSPKEAARFLLGGAPIDPLPRRKEERRKGLTPKEEAFLREAQARLGEEVLKRRGFTLEEARFLGLGQDREGNLVLPILGASGKPEAVKLRLQRGPYRYRYLVRGHGNPAWHSPGFGRGKEVLAVEGELNAMACYLALRGRLDVLGIPGAGARIPWESVGRRRVYLYADGDEAGQEALRRWRGEAEARGLKAFPLSPLPGGLDACKWKDRFGGEALREALEERMERAREEDGRGVRRGHGSYPKREKRERGLG